MTRGEMLGKMLVLATTGHAGQFDKGGKPYILHPLAVMNILNTYDAIMKSFIMVIGWFIICPLLWWEIIDERKK